MKRQFSRVGHSGSSVICTAPGGSAMAGSAPNTAVASTTAVLSRAAASRRLKIVMFLATRRTAGSLAAQSDYAAQRKLSRIVTSQQIQRGCQRNCDPDER